MTMEVASQTKVSIIIVNYFCVSQCIDAVKSIQEKTRKHPYEIIIVDNSNNEDEFNKLKNNLGNDCLLLNPNDNLGFGKANNLGVTKATGDYLFFQNPDTLLVNDVIDILADYLDCNLNIGIVGPNAFDRNNNPYHSFLKEKMDIKYEKKSNSFIGLVKRNFLKRRDDFNNSNTPLAVDGCIIGAFLMIRKALFSNIGGFDKDIFMFAEETMLCRVAIDKYNAKIINVPTAKIIHYEGGSFNKNYDKTASLYVNGNYIYYLKTFGKNYAIKYLKVMMHIYKRKTLISRLIKKQLHSKYVSFYSAYYDKYITESKKGEK